MPCPDCKPRPCYIVEPHYAFGRTVFAVVDMWPAFPCPTRTIARCDSEEDAKHIAALLNAEAADNG